MAGKILTVAQQKGGSGKTTLAANLAAAWSARGLRAALVDSDPQGSLSRWFAARTERSGADGTGLTLVSSTAWGVAYEAGRLKSDHDVVIVDTPPRADADLRPSLRVSDLMLVPVGAARVDLWATEGILELARREGAPALVILNRANPRARVTSVIRSELGRLGVPVAATEIGNRVAYAETLGEGLGVVEAARGTAAAREIAELAAEILGRLSV